MLHTNAWPLGRDTVSLSVGKLAGATDGDPITTAWVEVVEYLEETHPDGSDDSLVSTGLTYSSTSSSTFSLRDQPQLPSQPRPRTPPGHLRTRQPPPVRARRDHPAALRRRGVVIELDLAEATAFLDDLLRWTTPHTGQPWPPFDRPSESSAGSHEEPTGTYADLIAVLESLSKDETAVAPWENYAQQQEPRCLKPTGSVPCAVPRRHHLPHRPLLLPAGGRRRRRTSDSPGTGADAQGRL